MKAIYKTYVDRCKDGGHPPISSENFERVVSKQKKIMKCMVSLGSKDPWIISRIDNGYVLYASAKAGKVIVNVWTNKECEAFTGHKVGDNDKS